VKGGDEPHVRQAAERRIERLLIDHWTRCDLKLPSFRTRELT
jgi:hypothetical protein